METVEAALEAHEAGNIQQVGIQLGITFACVLDLGRRCGASARSAGEQYRGNVAFVPETSSCSEGADATSSAGTHGESPASFGRCPSCIFRPHSIRLALSRWSTWRSDCHRPSSRRRHFPISSSCCSPTFVTLSN